MVIRHLKAFDNEITQLSAYHWQSKFPSSFLTHFSPTTPTLSRFNLLAILKMWFLLLLLLVLVNCTVCASLFTKYTAVLAVFLAFRCSSLVPPFFHCLHAFHFSFTELTTSLLLHQDSLCHGHLPCPSTYFTCSCEKSIFDIFPNALHLCRNLLTFHWHCLFKFLLHNSIFQLPCFPSWWNTDGFDRLCWHNQITNKLFLLCNTLFTTDHFSILDVLQLCSPNKDEVNLCMITSRWGSNRPALFLWKKVLVIASLFATQKSRMWNPFWFLIPYPLPPRTPSKPAEWSPTYPLKSPPSTKISSTGTDATKINTLSQNVFSSGDKPDWEAY